MKYLLDTCALSELTKPRPSSGLVRWLAGAHEADVRLSVLTLGELGSGVERLKTGRRKRELEEWVEQMRTIYLERILDVTADVALEWGRMTARSEARGRPLPVIDALIGATALVHRLTVVTHNTSDLERTGARILDPWT